MQKFVSSASYSYSMIRYTGCPVTTSFGGRSKVNAAGTAPSSRARSAVFRSSAPWPQMCIRDRSYAEGGDKEYVAGLRLGLTTNTQDTTGEVVAERPVSVTGCLWLVLCIL